MANKDRDTVLGASVIYGASYTAFQSQLATLNYSIAEVQSDMDQITQQYYE